MDELTIDDKKYVSSKRAAQITGYAKDYIGQLCREGYVEARRVGRSWYVLEAAIKDHRFGNEPAKEVMPARETPEKAKEFTIIQKEEEHTSTPMPASAPRYEALEPPSINLLRKGDAPHEEPVRQEEVPTQDFHAAWQTWFDAFHTPQTPQAAPLTTPVIDVPIADMPLELPPKEEVSIPIHHLAPQESPLIAPLPLRTPATEVRIEDAMHRPAHPAAQGTRSGEALRVFTTAIFIIIIVASVALALVGSGYLDNYLISVERANSISGIMTVNK